MSNRPVQLVKYDEELRLVFGWANVSAYDGTEVVDSQSDSIPGDVLTKAFMSFMDNDRTGCVMHLRNDDGTPVGVGKILFAFPFTADIKKALGIDIPQEGVLIGFRADSDEVWEAVKGNKLQAFSIGGHGRRVEIDE